MKRAQPSRDRIAFRQPAVASSSSADESLVARHNRGTPELTETFREFHSTVAVALYYSSVTSTHNENGSDVR